MMAAGGPAGNTRSTFAGTGTTRPAPSVTVAARAGRGANNTAGRVASSVRRVRLQNGSLIDRDHHVARLDDGIRGLSLGEFQLVDRLVGDRRRDDGAANINLDVGGRGSLGDLGDLAFQLIARTEFHSSSPG